MDAPTFRVPEIPTQAYRSFRTMAEADQSMPRGIAARIEVPWALIVRHRIHAIVNFEDIKKKEET
jgi:hypothetical protein